LSSDCHDRIVHASSRRGIGLFRMYVQLDRILEAPAEAVSRDAAPAVAAVAAVHAASLFESEPCVKCGSRNVHRTRVRSMYERFRKLHTPARPFHCDDCGWRGWLVPLERAASVDEIVESDLRSLDVAFSSLAPGGERGTGGENR
jgi:predicted RNA-binding Zn-ribbon protein involved in translation (DUF1610 family)